MSVNPAYFDTTKIPRLAREAENVRCNEQEQAVLSWLHAADRGWTTREDLESACGLLTQSASRVLANLTERGLLEKSAIAQWRSRFGKSCHAWRLVMVGRPQRELFA